MRLVHYNVHSIVTTAVYFIYNCPLNEVFFYHADCDKDDDVRSLQRSESVCSTLAPLSSFLKYLLFPAMLVMSSVLAVAS